MTSQVAITLLKSLEQSLDSYCGLNDEGCADVCREFICPDCTEWNKEYSEYEKDESYCIDRMDEFFKTHELYATREGYYRIWKCRGLRGDSNEN